MKPTDEELRHKYQIKLERARSTCTEVQTFYSKLKLEPSESLEYRVKIAGCKNMIANLNGHIIHCKGQIKKYSKNNLINL